MGLTTRDLQVVRYLEKNFIINAEIASRLVYWTKNERSSLNVAQKRLKEMFRLKQVKRVREFVGQSYTYYLNKAPLKTKHRLMMTDFLSRCEMNGFRVDIERTEVEWKGLEERFGVRPDMLATIIYNDKSYRLLVEIDLTKEFSNAKKYERIMTAKRNGELKGILDEALAVVSVCDKKPEVDGFKPIWIKTDFSNFSNFTYAFIK